MKSASIDHFGSSKFKVTGFLKKTFIWLVKKEVWLTKVAQNRERERMILNKIFDIVSYTVHIQYVQWIIREKKSTVSWFLTKEVFKENNIAYTIISKKSKK